MVPKSLNKARPALDCYVNVMRDNFALTLFRRTQQMQRARWDLMVAADVKRRLVDNGFVVVRPMVVNLTLDGLHMLEYREET